MKDRDPLEGRGRGTRDVREGDDDGEGDDGEPHEPVDGERPLRLEARELDPAEADFGEDQPQELQGVADEKGHDPDEEQVRDQADQGAGDRAEG